MPDQHGRGGTSADRAIGELYHGCYRRLVTQVYAFTLDLAEAQDVVQEAFARALARPRGLTDIDNPEAWLRTVAINVVRRRWRRRQLLDTILRRDRPVLRLVEAAPGPERADLREALAELPVGYREVLVLHYFADLPVDEVAQVLGVAVGTVKSRLHRGRVALAARLGDYRDGAEPADLTDPASARAAGAGPRRPAADTGSSRPATDTGSTEVTHA
ncbi:RNA polymerase sigma-70 factor (ECF subfamily) [Micromonospora pisi]|uniref:RNA polymerase sigma factor n=1 Tax=Micromonospora pisi TaxID=589240 RepID=A0A495JJX3_9ACTN|nr:sigma-70 family RNA polymerase sigma factor [Micromonospora pisi]RKR88622.1 RNA polymerase sigma-70 factor (ECF subfamily) [Micromonospora pisi]